LIDYVYELKRKCVWPTYQVFSDRGGGTSDYFKTITLSYVAPIMCRFYHFRNTSRSFKVIGPTYWT